MTEPNWKNATFDKFFEGQWLPGWRGFRRSKRDDCGILVQVIGSGLRFSSPLRIKSMCGCAGD